MNSSKEEFIKICTESLDYGIGDMVYMMHKDPYTSLYEIGLVLDIYFDYDFEMLVTKLFNSEGIIISNFSEYFKKYYGYFI